MTGTFNKKSQTGSSPSLEARVESLNHSRFVAAPPGAQPGFDQSTPTQRIIDHVK
jgi:hypothetical protein